MTGLRRYANARDASEKAIVETLKAMGCDVVAMDKPCDLLVGLQGRNWLIECKSPGTQYGKKLNTSQDAFNKAWRGSGITMIQTPDEAARFVNNVRLMLPDLSARSQR